MRDNCWSKVVFFHVQEVGAHPCLRFFNIELAVASVCHLERKRAGGSKKDARDHGIRYHILRKNAICSTDTAQSGQSAVKNLAWAPTQCAFPLVQSDTRRAWIGSHPQSKAPLCYVDERGGTRGMHGQPYTYDLQVNIDGWMA